MKKTVFVSSTYQDLQSHRRAIWSLLEDFEVAVRGMEQFGARTETPLDTCIAEVEQCDIYVGVIAFRLGSVDEGTGKSFTQLEYDRAYELGKEILMYLIDEDNAQVKVKFIDKDKKRDKLEAFKRVLKDRHTIETFVSEDDLVEKLQRDVLRYLNPSDVGLAVSGDDFSMAKNTIEKFLLIPRAISGKEVALQVCMQDDIYPASREVCSAFNFEFGATVGIPVRIVKPGGFEDSGLDHLFFTAKQLDYFLPIRKGENRIIHAKLQFIDKEIGSVRTRFKSETYYSLPFRAVMTESLNALVGKPKRIEAEGRVILVLTENVRSVQVEKSSGKSNPTRRDTMNLDDLPVDGRKASAEQQGHTR